MRGGIRAERHPGDDHPECKPLYSQVFPSGEEAAVYAEAERLLMVENGWTMNAALPNRETIIGGEYLCADLWRSVFSVL